MTFGPATGRPVHVRTRQLNLMKTFMDGAAEAVGAPQDAVVRVGEADGLLYAMPVATGHDGAVERLPDSLLRQLARHNRHADEADQVAAILAFSCGPSEEVPGGLIGPGRDQAVLEAELPRLQDALRNALPGTVLVVIDDGLFRNYVEPEFGENLHAGDFTRIHADPPIWLCIKPPPPRPATSREPIPIRLPIAQPAPTSPGRRRIALAAALVLLTLGSLLGWKLLFTTPGQTNGETYVPPSPTQGMGRAPSNGSVRSAPSVPPQPESGVARLVVLLGKTEPAPDHPNDPDDPPKCPLLKGVEGRYPRCAPDPPVFANLRILPD
ncbi:hypothetical protein Acsp03_45040 [Actinomadura sp. NBRC 104412]|uniref:hypothetical protein n=1 Tax=Actinomadura sp. NBRC 104412 TaxID=3032203 RepID=UPI0024A2318D|nr:hypothetical protein [Actinomadura sp. NBRC 104412]GLZ07038.1 hypothetical protein Acsp03_45040 [Actinomadura sp. NBRC 104412]